jgi:hypothetical protein
MTTGRDHDYLAGLVRELCRLPRETEWVEFKVNQSDPQPIGEYISALANAAALHGKAFAYLVWGVEDGTHAIVGTNASLRARFGVEEKNKAAVSRFIREAVETGAIKPFDEEAARKLMKYVPFWA